MNPKVDLSDLTLSHPHDFFRVKHLSVEPGNCFVLMPFSSEFTIVYDAIQEALRGLMVCTRADDLLLGESILERILLGIATSELIIADLTGRNPNVFYELAIAHARTKNVLLLAQSLKDVPFDLRPFFCNRYSVSSRNGIDALKEVVRKAAKKVVAKRALRPLDSATTRTQRIVDYMADKLRRPEECKQLVIRIQASISSLGNTARSNSHDSEIKKYNNLLEEERDLLVQLIEQGASLYAILSPHLSIMSSEDSPEERKLRISKVIDFLKRSDDSSARCQVVLSPIRSSNLLFFGEEILFEGHKTSVEKGFGLTLVFTDQYTLRLRIGAFDQLFESAKKFTLEKYGPARKRKGESEALRSAVIRGLEESKASSKAGSSPNQSAAPDANRARRGRRR